VAPVDPGALVVQTRSWLAELRADRDGITEARNTAAKFEAMRAAAKRVGESAEMEAAVAEAARLSERRLGQLLTEGRKVGTVATGREGRGGTGLDVNSLSELGINGNLAADAVLLAGLDDEQWAELLAAARDKQLWSRASFRKAAQHVADEIEMNADLAKMTRRSADERISKIEREVRDMLDRLDDVVIPVPLETPDLEWEHRFDEQGVTDATAAVTAIADTPEEPTQWSRIRGESHAIEVLARRLVDSLANMPEASHAPFVGISVTAARRTASMMIDAVTAWIAAVNAADTPTDTNVRRIR